MNNYEAVSVLHQAIEQNITNDQAIRNTYPEFPAVIAALASEDESIGKPLALYIRAIYELDTALENYLGRN